MTDHGKPHRAALIASRKEPSVPDVPPQSGRYAIEIIAMLFFVLAIYGWSFDRDLRDIPYIAVSK